MPTTQLPEHSDAKRLEIFKLTTASCGHLFSKGKLQVDKWNSLAPVFADLAKNDPIFMASLAAWSANKDSKDMKVLSVFWNALSDADGLPFFKGSKKNKPNLRQVSAALLQGLDPHLALRMAEFCHMKFGVPGLFNESRHFPTGLLTAFRKYLRYREENPEMLSGARRAGLGGKLKRLYRLTHTSPSDEAAEILGWKQKDGRAIKARKLPDFASMSVDDIAKTLSETKLSPQVALSVLPPAKVTGKVAKALLGNATGNQAIILYNWFAKNGFLDKADIKSLFKEKAKSATTAVDRIDTLSRAADATDRKELSEIRSEKRKSATRGTGISKIFMHIDKSSSMRGAIEFAKEKGAVFAECVDNPAKNFAWGLFGSGGRKLGLPEDFTKESFHAALYGVNASDGSTDCLALYAEARKFGAEVDVYITDSSHNVGDIPSRIEQFHRSNPGTPKPRAAIIVSFGTGSLGDGLKASGIPVVVVQPQALGESALVAQSVRNALVGELAVIEEILAVPLPRLPEWWDRVEAKGKPSPVPA